MKKILVLFLISIAATAQLKVANVFGDHMVLQRDKPIKIWGWNNSGENVIINFNGQSQVAITDKNGEWSMSLSAVSSGNGALSMEIKDSNESINFSDILMGEVWLCSGQSNMEWRVGNSDNAQEELKKADKYPNIRHLEIPKATSFKIEKDFEDTDWSVSSSKTAGGFTAVGYFMAQKLHDELGVPIGLVHASWGGSHIETWISKEAMHNSDLFKDYAAQMPKNAEDASNSLIKNVIGRFHGYKDFDVSKINEVDYFKPNYDFSSWSDFNPLGQWDWKGVGGWRGSVFIQKEVEVSTEEALKTSVINFGTLYGDVSFYINGKLVGAGYYPEGVKVNLPENAWKAGKNSLLVKFSESKSPNQERGLGLYGGPSDFNVSIDGKEKLLMDSPWKTRPSWASPWHFTSWMNNAGTITYNAMIAPLIGLSIKGAIWYQGESNAGRAKDYQTAFPMMIKDWRKQWGEEFPFFWVQLATFGPFNDSNSGSNWAELREAQNMTLSLPKTGQAVITDVTDPKNLHPTNKQIVGERMAISALKVAYNENIVHSGPTFQSMAVKRGKAVLTFGNVGSGLKMNNKYGHLEGFEIAGADKKFYFAKSEIVGNTVVVYHPMVKSPKAVRYGWSNSPVDANLLNSANLPASPFRTDSWKGITEESNFE
jgi:sialate O-acetylesterase